MTPSCWSMPRMSKLSHASMIFPSSDTVQRHATHDALVVGRRDRAAGARERARLSPARLPQAEHLVALGDHHVALQIEVGHSVAELRHGLLRALGPLLVQPRREPVIDEVGAEDLVDDVEVPLVPDLLPETSQNLLVAFLYLAHGVLSVRLAKQYQRGRALSMQPSRAFTSGFHVAITPSGFSPVHPCVKLEAVRLAQPHARDRPLDVTERDLGRALVLVGHLIPDSHQRGLRGARLLLVEEQLGPQQIYLLVPVQAKVRVGLAHRPRVVV